MAARRHQVRDGSTGFTRITGVVVGIGVAVGLAMITPTKKRDWFAVDWETATPLYGLPGIQLDGGKILCHRSMLALLETPEASQFLLSRGCDSSVWASRDAWTERLGFKLRTTQQQAIDFLSTRRGGLLGDEQRLGKTLSAIMCHVGVRGPLWIIAPLSTRAVWLGWLKRVFPQHADNIGLVTGRKFDPAILKKPIVFGHYDVIHHWQGCHKIGTLILDEAHLLTNKDARRSEAAALLARWSDQVIALTGTPIWNLPPNLWNVAGLVAPGAFGSYYDFSMRYGAPESTGHGVKFTGLSNDAELRVRLNEIMLRRRWIDCHDDLPPISRSVVVAEVDDADRRRLDIFAGKLAAERTNTIGTLAAYRKEVTRLKVSTTIGQALKTIQAGEPVVIWTWHREFAEALYTLLSPEKNRPGSFLIHGEINSDERERRMNAWRGSETPKALIATMAVAQVGIDLSHARSAIFAEIDYTPTILGQAEMRTYSPTRAMDITFIVANHLIDQRLVKALVHKLAAADPLGVAAASDAIDALREAVMGPTDVGDLDRLLEDLLNSEG
jgi:SNF2 domain-containing protein/helicase-like protein